MPRNMERAVWALAKRYMDAIDAKQTEMQSDYSTLPSGYLTLDHLGPDVSGYVQGLDVVKGGQESAWGVTRLNLIEGSNVTLTVVPSSSFRQVDVTIAATGGGGAPTDAEYLTGATHTGLSAERVVTDTTTIAWDLSVGGQAKANVPNDGITYAKLQNISATDTVLGRATAGAGDPEEIPCTAAGRALIDDTTAGAQRATLGLGDAATKNVGTSAGTIAAGDDSRLSDARSPTAHKTTHEPGGGDAMTVDAAAGTGSLRTIGTGALQATAGNDSRLSDARTPTAHASTHKSGGSDAIRLDEFAAPTATVNFNGQQAAALVIENRTMDPASPTTGQLWIRTDLP